MSPRPKGFQRTAADLAGDEARRSTPARFWARVAISGPDECWDWIGPVNKWGYGALSYRGQRSNASRIAFQLQNGVVGSQNVVCHTCDRAICCNPGHLFAAPQSVNLADCRAKGRQVYKTGVDHHRVGAKLTPELVVEARERYAAGETQTALALEFGIHSSVLSRAIRGENWAHV